MKTKMSTFKFFVDTNRLDVWIHFLFRVSAKGLTETWFAAESLLFKVVPDGWGLWPLGSGCLQKSGSYFSLSVADTLMDKGGELMGKYQVAMIENM